MDGAQDLAARAGEDRLIAVVVEILEADGYDAVALRRSRDVPGSR